MVFKLKNEIYCCKNSEEDVEVLFIMESPFAEELRLANPCMGDSGMVMSKALGLKNVALGQLMAEEKEKRFAIFESFNFALDTRVCVELTGMYSPEKVYEFWGVCDIPWCGLKIQDKSIGGRLKAQSIIRSEKYDRKTHYKSLLSYIESVDNNIRTSFLDEYKKVLQPAFNKEKFPKLKEIVVCGYIAQSIFMEAFGKDNSPFAQRFKVDGFQIPVIFVEHPSHAPNGEWSYPKKIK